MLALCSQCHATAPAPIVSFPRSQAVLLSEKRGKERAAALAAKRAGKAAAKPKKSEAQKKVARDFYNQVCFVVHCYSCYLLVI